MTNNPSYKAQTIFNGKHVQVLHAPNESDWTLLTFDIMHARANGKAAFAYKLAQNLGVNFIGVVPKYPCWYPKHEMDGIADLIKEKRIGPMLAYGASMGGYGALRWGKLCGARSTLACSPQATIEPSLLGERDKRYQSRYIHELHAGMRINEEHLAERNIVIVDRFFKNDFVQANLLPVSNSLHKLFAPFMFHSTAKCISGRDNASKIFYAALEGNHNEIKKAIRKKRIAAFERTVNIAKTCNKRRRPLLAEKIIERLKESHPVDYALVTADAMRRSGRNNEARELYLDIIERDKDHKLAKQHLTTLTTQLLTRQTAL